MTSARRSRCFYRLYCDTQLTNINITFLPELRHIIDGALFTGMENNSKTVIIFVLSRKKA